VDHIGLCPADFDESLRFYVDGIGLEVIFDMTLRPDMFDLLGVHTPDGVRTCFLGEPGDPSVTRVELLDLLDGKVVDEAPRSGFPQRGLTLVSFVRPVERTLARLNELGLGGTPRIMPTPAGKLSAMVVDPDGVMVELLDQAVSF
jgi:glyoxylase I family protein